jgi:hypothetical protein
MRNKQPSNPSKTGLPVPAVLADALPVLTKYAQLDADLGALDGGFDEWFFGTSPSLEEFVSCLKAALPFIDKWRADWRALDRPSTATGRPMLSESENGCGLSCSHLPTTGLLK